MKITDEAVRTVAVALFGRQRIDVHPHRWTVSLQYRDDKLFPIVRAALEAAHLTDDGAAADESEWADEERDFVEVALRAADAGNAGHWPTVATYLAAEVRRLRAGEGATPAIDREALERALCEAAGSSRRVGGAVWVDGSLNDFTDALLALIGAPNSGASEDDQ